MGFVLGLDIDNTMGDYTSALREFLIREKGFSKNDLPTPHDYSFVESWGNVFHNVDEFIEAQKEFVFCDGFRLMPIYRGVRDNIQKMMDDFDVTVRIITSRLCINHTYQKAVYDTVQWLDLHKIPYNDLCFLGDKPCINFNLLVDDCPKHIINVHSQGGNTLVYNQRYNQHCPGARANNWEDVYHHVRRLVME